MTAFNDVPKDTGGSMLARFVAVERHEIRALCASFAMFFALLAGYYIVRPMRDNMGVIYGPGSQHELYTIVFFVMVAVVPAFGFVASRVPRRLVLPAIYGFFILCLIAFWSASQTGEPPRLLAATFYVWVSVFNLFVVSLFWSLMSELWSTGDAKRLYGFISAGGTAGALAGPAITQVLARTMAPANLLLIAAALLGVSLAMSLILRKLHPGQNGEATAAAGGGILDGARRVLGDPLFARIALFILLANIVGTFFYTEQMRLVEKAVAGGSTERLIFFSARDLIVSIATLTIEILGTAQVMRRLGLAVALAALPAMAAINTVAITLSPVLWVVAAALIAERVVAFSLSSPAIKVIYTTAKPDEKYKVQSFIDTVVYRGGDAASGWIFAIMGAGAGFASAAIPAITLPLVMLWMWNALRLGQSYEARVDTGKDAAGKV